MALEPRSPVRLLPALAIICFAYTASAASYTNGTDSTTSRRVGDLIAAGLSLSTLTSTVTVHPTLTSIVTLPSSVGNKSPGLAPATAPSIGASNSVNASTILKPQPSDSSSAFNLTYTGDCWDQWNEYWSVSLLDTQLFYNTFASVATATVAVPETVESYYTGVITLTETDIYTAISYEGAYPVVTSVVSSTFVETQTISGFTLSLEFTTGESTYVSTFTNSSVEALQTPKGGVTTPTCALPSIVPQCQSQWDAWLADNFTISDVLPFKCSQTNSANCASASASWESGLQSFYYTVQPVNYAYAPYTPLCSQASVPTSVCSTLVSSFLQEPDSPGGSINAAHRQLTPWPSASVLAPGCTLGCQTCAITGRSVQLFYWPPTTANGTALHISGSAIQTAFNASQPVIAITSGTTLTSPTIYISYDLLYASDSCSGIGKTYTSTFLPLTNSHDLSSLSFFGGDQDVEAGYATRSFNLNDLIPPIPNSVYNQDPRCQGSLNLWQLGHVNTSGFICPRTAPYAPIIAVPTEVLALDPEWKSCTAWYGGLYDPPKALQSATAIALPTLPGSQPTTTPASPSSLGLPSTASKTNSPETAQTSPSRSSSGSGGGASSSGTATSSPAAQSTGGPTGLPVEATSSADIGPSRSAGPSQSAGAGSTSNPAGAIASLLAGASSASVGSAQVDTQGAQPGTIAVSADPGAGSSAEGSTPEPQPAATGSDVATAIDPTPAGTEVFTFAGVTYTAIQSAGSVILDSNSPVGHSTDAADPADPTESSPGVNVASTQLVTAAGQTLTMLSPSDPTNPSAAVVNGVTLQSGAAAATISGLVVSAGSEGVVIGGTTTLPLAVAPGTGQTSEVLLSANEQTLTAKKLSGGLLAISGETLSRGGAAATLGTATISIASQALAVDGTIVTPVPASAGSVSGAEGLITIGGQTLMVSDLGQASANVIVVNGVTLSQNGPAETIAGQTIRVVSNGIVFDGSTTQLPQSPSGVTLASATVFTVNGQTLTASEVPGQTGNAVVVNGITVSPGGNAATLQGIIVSAASNVIVFDGSTAPFALPSTGAAFGMETVLTVNGHTLTASRGASQAYVVDGVTIANNGPATVIKGVTISAAGGGLVLDGTTTSFLLPSDLGSAPETIVTFEGHTLTAAGIPGQTGNSNAVIFDGITLSSGGTAAIIDGLTASDGQGGLIVSAGGSGTTIMVSSTSTPAFTSGVSGTLQQSPSAAATAASASSMTNDSSSRRAMGTCYLWLSLAVVCAYLTLVLI